MKKILYKGPDISYHNENVNIKKVRDAGFERIGIRAGYGKNNIDQRFTSNASACANLRVSPVIYWFSYAFSILMAKSEADYCCNQVEKYWKSCPVAYDFEYDSVRYARTKGININRELATNMAISFLSRVKARGYIPVLYTNRDYLKNYFDIGKITAALGKVYIWYARYGASLTESELNFSDIWQYTSSGKIPGIVGKCDINNFYTDFEMAPIPASRENSCNINIQNFQRAANIDGFRNANGSKLIEDGADGENTQYVRRKICLKALRSGLSWKVGSTGEVVRWWQIRCNEILGAAQKTDGKYGKAARAATIAVQKKLNLSADGLAGYDSLQAVFYN